MTDQPRPSGDDGQPLGIDIDTTAAHPARVHNYLAGGDGNFAADREAVEGAAAILPGGMDTIRRALAAMTAFQTRVVRYLVAEAGITQFFKVGTPVPAAEEVHEVAWSVAPDSRVVYVGNDPMVLAHAHSLRRAGPEGRLSYVHGDLGDAGTAISRAAGTLDFDRPVGLLLPATLNFIPDSDDPYGVVAELVAAVAPGSYLMLTHTSHDIRSERMREAAERFTKLLNEPYVARSRDEIARFLDGLELVEPGLVQVDDWRPEPGDERDVEPAGDADAGADAEPGVAAPPLFGAVARKP